MLVPRELLNSVAFIGQTTADGHHIGGSAFFVSVPTMLIPEHRHVYLVTARHVVEGATDLFVRLNSPFETGPLNVGVPDGDYWLTHPGHAPGEDFVDVAAMPLQDADFAFNAGYRWIARSMFFDESFVGDSPIAGVGVGDEVVTIGLLTVHYGSDRNEPVVRVGNLAMLPAEPVLVRYASGLNRRMRLYLTELRSISGLSGSPVFMRHRHMLGVDSQISLLGMMIGHWDDPNSNHMGFGKVVPAHVIIEVLDQEDEMKRRAELERKTLEQGGTAEPDSALPDETEFERFERLAKQVVNTPKPKAEVKGAIEE
jgi:hypothetical protein